MKKALITGVTGQDGSYLAELLLDKGYDVHGVIRRSSVDYRERIAHLEGQERFHLHYGDLGDSMSLMAVIGTVRPDEIYNLAAQSHVQVSFDVPEFTADIDATGVLRVLERFAQINWAFMTARDELKRRGFSLELMNKLKGDVVARISPWNKQHHADYVNYFIYQYYLSCSEVQIETLPADQQEPARKEWEKVLRPFKRREPWLCPARK